jgi:hypothetical protein
MRDWRFFFVSFPVLSLPFSMQTPFPGLFYRRHSRSARASSRKPRASRDALTATIGWLGFPRSALVLGGVEMATDCNENLPVGSREKSLQYTVSKLYLNCCNGIRPLDFSLKCQIENAAPHHIGRCREERKILLSTEAYHLVLHQISYNLANATRDHIRRVSQKYLAFYLQKKKSVNPEKKSL